MTVRTSILIVGPTLGGVAGIADAVAANWAAKKDRQVHHLRLHTVGLPAIVALRAVWRYRTVIRRAAIIHVEFGRLNHSPFWFAAFVARLRTDVVVVAHDAPNPISAPGASLLGSRGRLRRAIGLRILSPLLDRRILRWVSRSAGVGVVFSESAAAAWQREGPRTIVAIDHGADPPSSESVAPSKGRHVLFAGFLGPSKGLDVLLEAWDRIGNDSPLPLLIAGEPATEADAGWLRALKEQRRPGTNVPRWLGRVEPEQFAELFSGAAAVVLPYRSSNPASGVLVRAMVEGRAVITTRSPAALDALDEQSALFIETEDSNDLAKALKRVIDNPELRDRLGATAARQAAHRFTWPRHLSGLQRAYALAGVRA